MNLDSGLILSTAQRGERRAGPTVEEAELFTSPAAHLVSPCARARWPAAMAGRDANAARTVWTLSQRDPRGVMVRGIWLDAATLASIRESVQTIYRTAGADTTLDNPSSAQIDALVAGMEALGAKGWIFNDHQLEVLAEMLREKGRPADADRVVALSATIQQKR